MVRDVKTPKGVPFDEVISTLQKEIRRGHPEAVYWCQQAYSCGEGATRTNLWNRLLVIAVEDIGLADPMGVLVVLGLYEQANNISTACTATEYLVKAKKTRLNDWSYLYNRNRYKGNENPIELQRKLRLAIRSKNADDALMYAGALESTTHEVVSRRFKKAWHLIPEVIIEEIHGKYTTALKKVWMMNSWKCTSKSMLLFSHLIWLWCLDKLPKVGEIIVPLNEVQQFNEDLRIPDYAIDKHTLKGKIMGRSYQHFMEEGSKLENIDEDYENMSKKYI